MFDLFISAFVTLFVVIDPPASASDLPDVQVQTWKVVGLDQSIPMRAIAVVDRALGEDIARRRLAGVGVYAPVFDRWSQ